MNLITQTHLCSKDSLFQFPGLSWDKEWKEREDYKEMEGMQ